MKIFSYLFCLCAHLSVIEQALNFQSVDGQTAYSTNSIASAQKDRNWNQRTFDKPKQMKKKTKSNAKSVCVKSSTLTMEIYKFRGPCQ